MNAGALAVEIVAFGGFAALSIVLTIVDVRTHRLPDRLVLPAYPAAAVVLTIAALLREEPLRLVVAVGGAAGLFAFYLALRMLRPGAMGGGDVKLAGVVGGMLGYLGVDAVLAGTLAGFIAGGLYATVLLLTRRARTTSVVAFGPWMLLGAWVVIAATAASRVG